MLRLGGVIRMSGKITASEIPTSQTDVSKSLKWAVLCLFVIFMFILCVYYIILRFCASVCVEPLVDKLRFQMQLHHFQCIYC